MPLQELSVMYHVKTGLNGDSVPLNGEGAALEHVWLWVVTMSQLGQRVRDKKLKYNEFLLSRILEENRIL